MKDNEDVLNLKFRICDNVEYKIDDNDELQFLKNKTIEFKVFLES